MSDFVIQTRDQRYQISVTLYNPSGYQYTAEMFSLEAVCIEESLHNWSVKGYIVISMWYEMLEKGGHYVIRNDSRNRVAIEIKPLGGDWNPDYGTMNFDCIVYDVEDLPHTDNLNKLRKLYIVDERYQFFKELNMDWSTAWWSKNEKSNDGPEWTFFPPSTKDYKKSMRANRALKALILAAASTVFDPNNPDITIGDAPLGDIQDWDEGDLSNRLFYTSPANFSVLDDIRYLTNNLKGASGDPVFLRFGRSPGLKAWNLIPLKDILDKSSENQIERIQLQDTLTGAGKPYVARAPAGPFVSPIASVITRYKFAHMSAEDADRITNKALHHFNFATCQYNIYQELNKATAALDAAHNYAEGLFGHSQSGQLLVNINFSKRYGLMQQHIMSPMHFIQTEKLQRDMVHDIFLMNQALYFKTEGLTLRQPGKFIFVDKRDSQETNAFDDRVLGQWLLSKVTHFFTRGQYTTDVVAVKADAFSSLWSEIDV